MASNDFVISTDLIVFGMSTFAGGQTFDGQTIIDVDDSEALLVRKDGDGGDVFVVDTSNDIVRIGSGLATAGDGLDLEALVLTGDGTRDSHSILFTGQQFGESSLTERDWKMFADISINKLAVDFQTNSGGYVNIFGLNTIGELTLGLGVNAGPASVGLLLARAPRTTDGNDNSTQLQLQGRSFETSTPHSITWQLQTILLDNLGDSELRWSSAVDGSFGTRMTLSDGSAVLTVGSIVAEANPSTFDAIIVDVTAVEAFIVRENADAGDVFIVNTSTPSATLPHVNSFISLGPNTAGSGDIRFGNGRFLAWRNTNNNGDLHALSIDEDDFLNLGTVNAPKVRILSPSFVALGPGPYSFGSLAALTHVQFVVQGSFTSSGASNLTSGGLFASDITSFSGDLGVSQVRMGGTTVGGSLTTSGAGDSLLAATLWLDEPDITLTPTDAMALAATLYISGAPTEGTSANYALFIDNGTARFDGAVQMFANSTFVGPANTFTFGSGVDQTHAHVALIGAFTSSGISNHGERLFIGGSITGFAVDTLSLAGLLVDASVTTQGNTDTIADVAQVIIQEPNISVGTGDIITNAQTLLINGAPTEGASNYALRVSSGDVLFADLQFSVGEGSIGDIFQVEFGGNFGSGGSSTFATNFRLSAGLVGAAGDTASLTNVRFEGGVATQTATESIGEITQLRVAAPTITDNLTGGGLITTAQSLLIPNAPTAGVNNYALRVITGDVLLGGNLAVSGAGPHAIAGAPFGAVQLLIGDTFTSDGASNIASGLFHTPTIVGAPGDTAALTGTTLTAGITTQTATESIANIAQLQVNEPFITDNLTGDITNAQTLLLASSPTEGEDNFALRSLGAARTMFVGLPFSIGSNVVQDVWQVQIRGNFTSGGASNRAAKFEMEESVIGVSGDTVFLGGAVFGARITTQTAAEVVADVFQVRIQEPTITLGAGSSITNAQSLLVVSAPTEGVSNFAVRVISGATFLGGELEHAGSTLGFFGTSPTTQPAAYTRNATIVEDRTLLASASASALNNNNVLAALIADLQSLGVIG